MPRNNLPVVILVRPQLGENIGAVARAMSNFGLRELRLAAPRDGWPNKRALETASGGGSIIEAAKVFPDFKAALSDIHIAIATTARPRDMEKRVLAPDAACAEIAALLPPPLRGRVGVGGTDNRIATTPPPASLPQGEGEIKIALVFGPERTGLENEEIVQCDTLVTIPTAPENSSLNIAQSAVVLFYEWWKQSQIPAVARALPEIAAKEDWQGLFAQLESYLDETNYYRVPDKKTVMWQNLQNMLLRGTWSAQEVRTFRGMLRAIWERRRKSSSDD